MSCFTFNLYNDRLKSQMSLCNWITESSGGNTLKLSEEERSTYLLEIDSQNSLCLVYASLFLNWIEMLCKLNIIFPLQTCNSLGVCIFCVAIIKFWALRHFGTGRSRNGITKNARTHIHILIYKTKHHLSRHFTSGKQDKRKTTQ